MRAATDAEEASDKHPVTPGNVLPARELLGEMLLLGGQPAEAQAEFERSLKRDPNRFRGVYGAARAAQDAGNLEQAAAHYRHLLNLAAAHDVERPELLQAREFLAQRGAG
ncbi:Tetratricopeptide repeat protein [compost metagenome]